MDKKTEVSIVKCKNIDSLGEVKRTLNMSLELIGGIGTVLRRGDKVIIKPNLFLPLSYKTGATTNPLLIEALIDILRENGIKKIIIGEGSVIGENTERCFKECGIEEIAKRKEVELLDFKKDDFIPMSISNGKVFRILKIPKTVAYSDAIINLPVLKTHDCFPVTLGLKNMKGVIHEKDKARFHLLDLAQCIVDLNKIVLPRITIIDGTVGMEGMGPAYGLPANMGIILSSFDTVAADTVGSMVMGIDPMSVSYIKLAAEQGLGFSNISDIDILGSKIEEVGRKFKRIFLEDLLYSKEFEKYSISIIDGGACSGCKNVMTAIVGGLLSGDKRWRKIENTVFIMGQNVNLKQVRDIGRKIVYLGTCTKKIRTEEGNYLPGCPPHILDVMKKFLIT